MSVLMSRSKPIEQVVEVPEDSVAGYEAMGFSRVPESKRDEAAAKVTYPNAAAPDDGLVVMVNKKNSDLKIAVPAASVEGHEGLGWKVAPKTQQADAEQAVAVPNPAPEG